MFKPLNNNVIIKKISEEVKTKSGIILTASSEDRERNDIGVVVAVSEKVHDLKVWEQVIYSKYAGSTLKENNEDYLIISIDDILAVKEE